MISPNPDRELSPEEIEAECATQRARVVESINNFDANMIEYLNYNPNTNQHGPWDCAQKFGPEWDEGSYHKESHLCRLGDQVALIHCSLMPNDYGDEFLHIGIRYNRPAVLAADLMMKILLGLCNLAGRKGIEHLSEAKAQLRSSMADTMWDRMNNINSDATPSASIQVEVETFSALGKFDWHVGL